MNASDFCWLIDSYYEKFTDPDSFHFFVQGQFRYCGSGAHRSVYKYENFVVKFENRWGAAASANKNEFEFLKFIQQFPRISHHFPTPYYASKDYRVIVVEFVEGKTHRKVKVRSFSDRYSNGGRLYNLLKFGGVPAQKIGEIVVDDVHGDNIIVRQSDRKRVFIDLGHCRIDS